MKRYTRGASGNQNHNASERTSVPFLSKSGLIYISITALLIVFIIFGIAYLGQELPSLKQLEMIEPELASKLFSQDGKVIKELFIKKRTYTPLDSIPDILKHAVISTEDRQFYSHWGFNSKRFIKALLIDIISMRYKQGASTLSQQLARSLFLTPEKKIIRKVKELLTSIQIERTYTKNEILEMYLNQMYYGHGAYGVQAAAHRYFKKRLFELTPADAALIVAQLQRPSYYSPYRNPKAALHRRNVILNNMRVCGYLSEDGYEFEKNRPLTLSPFTQEEEFGIAPYFTEWVRQELQKKYGYNVYTDGLSVYTTLDSRLQAAAEAAIKTHLPEVQASVTKRLKVGDRLKRFIAPELLAEKSFRELKSDTAFIDSVISANAAVQVALVSIDPRTGYILAMVGGRDFAESKFNRAIQALRQPGSAFKPIAYAAAIDNGYSPSTELLNQPVVVIMPDGKRWQPQNYDRSEGGPTTLRKGLQHSLNLIAARLVQELVPPRQVVDFAHKLGITNDLQAVDAIALGACEVIPIEITSAFGVFANKGLLAQPIAITKVVDKYGNVLEQNQPVVREALRKEVAYIMADMLKSVILHGTGVRARFKYQFMRPAGGKTGTTNDYGDGWFIGFTPQIVTGVWVGCDNLEVTLGQGAEGAKVALPIWAPYMKTAHDTLKLHEEDFEMPIGVVKREICADSKQLATDSCPNIVEEVFLVSSAPTKYCEMHSMIRKSGRQQRDRRWIH
ncbi:PBP1A family penicillin-binding protein [candidate division KSB1 bacterium]|nr:PBP1A family penicillin-binding protein [candidate division KSB1 bacterium]